MEINILEAEKNHISHFNDPFYDSIIEIATILFGKKAVSLDLAANKIYIHDKIDLTFSCSMNESKVYIHTYILKNVEKVVYSHLNSYNHIFRIFGLEPVKNYLLLKKAENDFIAYNEG